MNKLSFLIVLLISLNSYSQSEKKLLSRLQSTLEDSVRANTFNLLSKQVINENPKQGKLYAQNALAISERISYNYGIGFSFSNIGYFYLLKNNYDSSLYYFNKGIVITNNQKYKDVNSELLNRKAAVFYYMGITDSSLLYFKKALSQYEELRDSNSVIKALNNIGAISLRSGDLDAAMVYFFKCLKYDEKQKNNQGIAIDCNNIGIILTSKKNYNSAITYLQRALKIKKEAKDTFEMQKTQINIANIYNQQKNYRETIKQYIIALKLGANIENNDESYSQITNNIGECYSSIGKNDSAMYFLNISLNLKRKLGNKSGISATLGNIGNIYFRQKNYQKAIDFYTESFEIAKQTVDLEFQKNAQKILAMSYMNLNQKEKALQAMQLFTLLQDSLFNEISMKHVAETQIKYETEKKEAENKMLQQQNSIKTLENDKNKQTIFILIACIFIATIIVLWQISLARVKKQKRALETEKKLQQDRERISRDLHDNVGGQLSYVMFSLEANEENTPEKRKEKAHNLANALRSVTGNLRETIWALNQEKLTVQNISDKLKVYARNIFAYSSTNIRFDEVIEKDEPLNPAFALNFFRICQEIINNVFKHAQASELRITIIKKEKLEVIIVDNGIGFNAESSHKESFGLSNLKTRADEINASLTIYRQPNKGTTVTLVV